MGAVAKLLDFAVKDFFAVNFKPIPHTEVYILDILRRNEGLSLERTAFTLGVKSFENLRFS